MRRKECCHGPRSCLPHSGRTGGHCSPVASRRTLRFQQNPPAVRIGQATCKSFIRGREDASGLRPASGAVPCALTRNRPRVSYLERRSFGIQLEPVPGLGRFGRTRTLPSGFQRNALSNRKLTVAGSQARPREADALTPRAAAGPVSRAPTGGFRRPGPFPETNLFSGSRPLAGLACAPSPVRLLEAPGRVKEERGNESCTMDGRARCGR